MTPELIIERLAADGIRLSLDETGKLKASGQQEAVSRWLPTIKEHKPGLVAVLTGIRAGSKIVWEWSGKPQTGTIDFLHVDSDGIVWGFVTIGDSWAAVNLKFAKQVPS